MNYYQKQLAKIEFDKIYPSTVKFKCEKGETNWLDMNKESAEEIIRVLKREFNLEV
ncbi:hypothetical protein M0R04_05465 [Candidatus Dojkabacteria bacterium]|jgi:hypothetical protein|nr:hypothetical protein [Candidatus Dojkabacteria bacterium]